MEMIGLRDSPPIECKAKKNRERLVHVCFCHLILFFVSKSCGPRLNRNVLTGEGSRSTI